MKGLVSIVMFGLSIAPLSSVGQATVNWIGFEQLEDSLSHQPKKVFIDFYTDWCVYCRKMDKRVFTDPEVIDALNEEYYSVRMDAETLDTIAFDGQKFVNAQAENRQRGIHQLALILGSREGEFAPPTMVVLDEGFRVKARYFQYLSREELLEALR